MDSADGKNTLVDNRKYAGMDVHQATISVAVVDSARKVGMDSVIETKAVTILEFIQGLRGSLSATFEGGCRRRLAVRPAAAAGDEGGGVRAVLSGR